MDSVFLDLDNTLTDRVATLKNYALEFLNDFQSKLLPDINSQDFTNALNKLDKGGYTTHERRSQAMMELPIWHSKTTIEELMSHWQSRVSVNAVAMPGLYDCLDLLKDAGLKICLVSNGKGRNQRAKLKCLDIESYFDAIIISEEVESDKPDLRIFKIAMDSINCKPQEGIFVGDHPLNDYWGSKQAGLTPVWFEGAHEWPKEFEKPLYVIDHLHQLSVVLDKFFGDSVSGS